MNKHNKILIKTVSQALETYAISKGLSFTYDSMPLSIEETFSEEGGLILFLFEAKTLYESIFKEEYVSTIIEYDGKISFPLDIIKMEGESFFDYIPALGSARNFESVLVFSIHALIELCRENDTNILPLDELHERFFKNYVKYL